jgi:hypothetical protein
MPLDLRALPEPAELHARFAAQRALHWADPLPTKAQITAEFGPLATGQALSRLDAIGWMNAEATGEMLASARPGSVMYQLDRRIKSPQSLARKVRKYLGRSQRPPSIEDLQRFTVIVPAHDELVDLVKHVASELQERGWQLNQVRNSYTEGSRYKGFHLDTQDPRGQRIEVQLHTTASIAVKEATTTLYEIERDTRVSKTDRDDARAECVRLSAKLPTPQGLDELTDLGGCPVTVRGYGLGRTSTKHVGVEEPHVPNLRLCSERRRLTGKEKEL